MDVPFHLTGYGRKFYEHDVPKLVRALERLAPPTGEDEREQEYATTMSGFGPLVSPGMGWRLLDWKVERVGPVVMALWSRVSP